MRTRQETVPRRYSRTGIGGDGSTLNLDFTKMSALDSRFTFTRSTTATYINSSGYVATMAAAATNDPTKARFDYDPTTLAPKGLLIEGSAINVLPASQNLSNASYWTIQTAYTSVSTTETSPSNVGNANLFTEPNIANPRSIYQNFALTAGTYTASIFVKYNTGTVRGLRVVLSSASNNFGYVTINMSTGAVIQSAASVGTASNTSATITAYPNSWYRITLTTTLAATANFIFLIPVSISGIGTPNSDYGRESYTGNSSTFSLWGAQVEAGTGASSYIPTTASQVTRALDSCIMNGTSFSSWFNATQGTLLTTWSGTSFGGSGRYATINDGSSSNQIWTGYSESAIYNGSFQALFNGAGTANGKVAIAYALNDAAWCLSGGTVSTDTSVTLPTGLNQVTFGANPAGAAQINTSLKTIKFFPTRLSNAQLQAITT